MEQHPEQENFEKLSQLLSLKRHETPPPRFFGELSGRVMHVLEKEKPVGWESWLDRLLSVSWFQPVAAGAMALLIGGLVIIAVTQPSPSDRAGQAMFPGNSAPSASSTNLDHSSSLKPLAPQ